MCKQWMWKTNYSNEFYSYYHASYIIIKLLYSIFSKLNFVIFLLDFNKFSHTRLHRNYKLIKKMIACNSIEKRHLLLLLLVSIFIIDFFLYKPISMWSLLRLLISPGCLKIVKIISRSIKVKQWVLKVYFFIKWSYLEASSCL